MENKTNNPFAAGRYPVNLTRAIFGYRHNYDLSEEEIARRESKIAQDPEIYALVESKLMTLDPLEMQAIKYHYEKGMDFKVCATCLRQDFDEIGHIVAKGLRKMRHPSRSKDLKIILEILDGDE